jgi:peptide deformylase
VENRDIEADGFLDQLLMLGDPRLYQMCEEVVESDKDLFFEWKQTLHQVMEAVRSKYGFGRAIAAPQVGIMKRIVYLNIDRPILLINPKLSNKSKKMIEIWDDCMSLPNLLVKVRRHKSILLSFYNEDFEQQTWKLADDMSELIQHECDHLDGVLCTMRAIDQKSFKWRDLK